MVMPIQPNAVHSAGLYTSPVDVRKEEMSGPAQSWGSLALGESYRLWTSDGVEDMYLRLIRRGVGGCEYETRAGSSQCRRKEQARAPHRSGR